MVTNADLFTNKYSIKQLEREIKNNSNLNLYNILYTQYLTPDFCVEYLLSEKYASTVEEKYISIDDIIINQPHIDKNYLIRIYKKYT
jgi:hypothetical protein